MYKKHWILISMIVVLALLLAACQPSPATEEIATEEMESETVEEEEPEAAVEEEAEEEAVEESETDITGELIISVWGGTTEEFIRENVEPEFNEIYPNVTVIYDVGGQSDRYNKLLAQKNSPEIDLFVSTNEAMYSAIQEDLVVPLNKENIPNLESLHDWAVLLSDYGTAYAATVYGLGYDLDFFGDNPPTSWNDLWRPEVQGIINVPAIGHSMMPQFIVTAAELNGGSLDNVEPGFEYLAELDPGAQTFFYTGWNAAFDAGDIVLAVDFDYYINTMADAGSNIKWVMPEEGGWGSTQSVSVVAGTENQKMAETFINVLLSPEVQDAVGNKLLQAPARKDIELSDELSERLAAYGDSLSDVRWLDPAVGSTMRPEWTEKMNEIVAPSWAE